MLPDTVISPAPKETLSIQATAADIVFATLPVHGFDTMTCDGVEFVLCASALTAQM